MSEPLARDVLTRLMAHPSLCDTLSWTQIQLFIRISYRIWPEIVGSSTASPLLLPLNICEFLSSVLNLEFDLVQLCWTAFGDMVPNLDDGVAHTKDDDLFRIHGHEYQIGVSVFYSICLGTNSFKCRG